MMRRTSCANSCDCLMKTLTTFALLLFSARLAHAASCESLTGLTLPNTNIPLAQNVAAGAFTPPVGPRGRGGQGPQANPYRDLPAFCRVAATLTPSSDSDIKIEVWLPAANWN